MDETISEVLEEQKAYYRARASEYDEWFLRQGRYDRGPEHRAEWFSDVETVRGALAEFVPFGDVLEFAGGTGLWTERLTRCADRVTVVDASNEMIAINRARVGRDAATFEPGDIFSYRPPRQFDFVFFGFWLSHVPSSRFDEFWSLVRSCLKPDGRFFFVDSAKEQASTAVDHVLPSEDDSESLVRRLNDGREFRIIKLFYHPEELQERLQALGFNAEVRSTERFFLYGSGSLRSE